ncbi:MAG: hypothetical protein R2849_08800 [Thermomicrobiales bacterium]
MLKLVGAAGGTLGISAFLAACGGDDDDDDDDDGGAAEPTEADDQGSEDEPTATEAADEGGEDELTESEDQGGGEGNLPQSRSSEPISSAIRCTSTTTRISTLLVTRRSSACLACSMWTTRLSRTR